jgi:hypothetical protein
MRGSRASRLALSAVVLSLALGCASTPRPRALTDLDLTRESPALVAARKDAPQAFARAEALRQRAEAAHDAGDPASAQILAERAHAAYERAVTLSSLVRAEERTRAADASLGKVDAELARTAEAQAKLDAETRALDLRLKVARETLPVPESGPPASPERELARREAAQALTAQARLLCTAARLVEPGLATLPAALAKVTELEARLPKAPMAPLDEARTARTGCLKELTVARRPRTQADPVSPAADRLLSELGQASLKPSRDDRGVVVTLERAFERDDRLTKDAEARLGELAAIAKSHPAFPVLVVVHSAVRLPEPREAARVERTAAALRASGAPTVEAASVGNALPGLDRRQPGAAARNERVEVVFVAPTAT